MAIRINTLKHLRLAMTFVKDFVEGLFTDFSERLDELTESKADKKIATTEENGLMSKEDKEKLNNLNIDSYSNIERQVILNKVSIGLQRKNLLPNKCQNTERYGIKATVSEDGTITLNGQSTYSAPFVLYYNMQTGATSTDTTYVDSRQFVEDGEYILSGGVDTAQLQLCAANEEVLVSSEEQLALVYSEEAKVTISGNYKYVWTRLLISRGAKFNNVKIRPMLRYSHITDSTYEPCIEDLQSQINNVKSELDISSGSSTQILNKIESNTKLLKTSFDLGSKNILRQTLTKSVVSQGIVFAPSVGGTWNTTGSTGAQTAEVILTSSLKVESSDDYVLSGCAEGGSDSSYYIEIASNNGTDSGGTTTVGKDYGNGVEVQLQTGSIYTVKIVVKPGTEMNDMFFEPMLCLKNLYDTYPEFSVAALSNTQLTPRILTNQETVNTSGNIEEQQYWYSTDNTILLSAYTTSKRTGTNNPILCTPYVKDGYYCFHLTDVADNSVVKSQQVDLIMVYLSI